MPEAIARGCDRFGCGHTKPCPDHGRTRTQRSAFKRGYGKRWQAISVAHLHRYPRCGDRPPSAPATTSSRCRADGRVVPATVTDHIVPHRGDKALLWAESNRQSLCASCHGVKSRGEQRT